MTAAIHNHTRHATARLSSLVAQALLKVPGGPRVPAPTAIHFHERGSDRLDCTVERQGAVTISIALPVAETLPAELIDAPPALERALARVARAVARRRVGVALSGGGAWGFAHCALLRGLAARGIAVDVVAGASFGSVVGAFYAAAGLDGLTRLEAHAGRIGGALKWCTLTTAPIARFIDAELGRRALAELEIAFLPVAVELVSARETVLADASLATAVRASCAFPGLWGPLARDGGRYVDGCITSNVPVRSVAAAGADLIIASSVMRPPAARPPSPPRSPLAQLWSTLSPAARARDLRRAIRLLGYSVSRQQAESADLAFLPELSPFGIADFAAAPRIIAKAAAQLDPLLDAAAQRLAQDQRTIQLHSGAPSTTQPSSSQRASRPPASVTTSSK